MSRLARSLAVACLGLALAASGGCSAAQQSPTPPRQQGGGTGDSRPSSGTGNAVEEGAALAQEKCTTCHSFDRVASAKKDEAGWRSTIDRMVGHGLQITDAERDAVVGYLVSK